MFGVGVATKIYLAPGSTDMRKYERRSKNGPQSAA
jgi:hypothetical protein